MDEQLYLYRLEAEIGDECLPVIVVAKTDEKAFAYAENELEKSLLKLPEQLEIMLYEKKRLRNGCGYVLNP